MRALQHIHTTLPYTPSLEQQWKALCADLDAKKKKKSNRTEREKKNGGRVYKQELWQRWRTPHNKDLLYKRREQVKKKKLEWEMARTCPRGRPIVLALVALEIVNVIGLSRPGVRRNHALDPSALRAPAIASARRAHLRHPPRTVLRSTLRRT